jgi:cytochrome oxidase Cu insertion factor (SCO1/SenC/PrrC family)
MSGFNSSTQDAASEPLSFTVHSLPRPRVGDERTRSGRLKMLLVLLVCAAPVIASYLTYFVVRPQGRTNYGALIVPTRSMPALGLRRLDGAAVDSASLKGQWLLIAVGPARCDMACDKRLFMQRQLREMLGKDRDRLDKLWLITDGALPSAELRAAAESAPAMQILQADLRVVASWLTPEPGHALEEHLYLVDPMGEWMMRMPVEPEPAKVKRDLERLLRASAGWDKPGR